MPEELRRLACELSQTAELLFCEGRFVEAESLAYKALRLAEEGLHPGIREDLEHQLTIVMAQASCNLSAALNGRVSRLNSRESFEEIFHLAKISEAFAAFGLEHDGGNVSLQNNYCAARAWQATVLKEKKDYHGALALIEGVIEALENSQEGINEPAILNNCAIALYVRCVALRKLERIREALDCVNRAREKVAEGLLLDPNCRALEARMKAIEEELVYCDEALVLLR